MPSSTGDTLDYDNTTMTGTEMDGFSVLPDGFVSVSTNNNRRDPGLSVGDDSAAWEEGGGGGAAAAAGKDENDAGITGSTGKYGRFQDIVASSPPRPPPGVRGAAGNDDDARDAHDADGADWAALNLTESRSPLSAPGGKNKSTTPRKSASPPSNNNANNANPPAIPSGSASTSSNSTAATRTLIPGHDDASNPLGPIPLVPNSHTTTSTTRTVDPQTGSKTSTITYTTVLPATNVAYRTTITTETFPRLSHNAGGGGQTSKTYEKSVPGGDTTRINLVTLTNGSVQKTTELIRPGGSTTVTQEVLDAETGARRSVQTVEYPPMEIVPQLGWDKVDRFHAARNGGGPDDDDGGDTVVSELTYPRLSRPIDVDDGQTMAGNTFRCEDPTLDPTYVDYNAGYVEEMAEKHGSSSAGGSPGRSRGGGSRKGGGGGGGNNLVGGGGKNGNSITESFGSPDGSYSVNKQQDSGEGGGFWSSSKKFVAFAILTVLAAAAIGAGVGVATSSRSDDPSGGTAPTPPNAPTASGPTFAPTVYDPIIAAGFDYSWPSEDGWIVDPSFATTDDYAGGGGDGMEVAGSGSTADGTTGTYYRAYYITGLDLCADRCGKTDTVGGAYFPGEDQDVCICFLGATCREPTLIFGGGTVFMKEPYIEETNVCDMSMCGYYPDDPICDGLVVRVEASVPVEIKLVDGLMSTDEEAIFEAVCGTFLAQEFTSSGSPVDGVRCEVDGQELLQQRRRRLEEEERHTHTTTRVLQAADQTLRIDLRASGTFVPTDNYPDAESVEFGESVEQFFDESGDQFVQDLYTEAGEAGTDYFDDVAILSVIGPAEPVEVPTLPPVTEPMPTSRTPTAGPTTNGPTLSPTTAIPTVSPTWTPTRMPVTWPTTFPPTVTPSLRPTPDPTQDPTRRPTSRPTLRPTPRPTQRPTPRPTQRPTRRPTPRPTSRPSRDPTQYPTPDPTRDPTPKPQSQPTPKPQTQPTASNSPSYCLNSKCWQQIGSDLVSSTANDQFGDYVNIDGSGTRFTVSATTSSESGASESGTVRVFSVQDDGTFSQVGKPIYGEKEGEEIFGVLSEDGLRLAVGNQRFDDSTGYVQVYELSSDTWVSLGDRISGGDEGERFGRSVAISKDGSIIAAGAPFADDQKGAVRVYKWNGKSWQQLGDDIKGQFEGGKLGWDVSLASGALILAIGQKSDDDDNGRSGQARIFQWDGSSDFAQFGDPVLGDSPGDNFGRTVAISSAGTTFASGALFHDGPNGEDSGQVQVFSYIGGGTWYQTPSPGSDIDGDGPGDRMQTVSLNSSGDRVAAGTALGDDTRGYVRVYDNNGNEWEQVGGKLSGQQLGERFGTRFSLSPDGSRLLVGAPAKNGDDMKGRVRLYELRSQ